MQWGVWSRIDVDGKSAPTNIDLKGQNIVEKERKQKSKKKRKSVDDTLEIWYRVTTEDNIPGDGESQDFPLYWLDKILQDVCNVVAL